MFLTKNLTRYGYGCLLAIVLAGVLLTGHVNISALGVDEPGLSRTDGYITTGTCSRSGVYTQKLVRNPSAHSTYTAHWSPGLPDLTFGYWIVLDGYGFVTTSMNYSVNGVSGTKNWPPLRVGDWGHKGISSLWAPHATRVTAAAYDEKISNLDIDVPDTAIIGSTAGYNWSSSGTANLQAMYCKRTAAFWGQWEPLGQPIPETWNSQGSWELKMTYVCPKCSQDVSHFSQHQLTCSRCGKTYWDCNSNSYIHKRTTPCYGCGKRIGWCQSQAYGPSNTPHRWTICTICGQKDYNCGTHVCSSGSGSGSSSGASSGTTTSPTVSSGGGSGGTTGGTSSDRVRCGHSNCQRGGWASSREAHKTTCPAGHRYYECSLRGNRFHANCRARRSGEVRCARGSWCRSGGYASSRNAHQTTCGRGHTYWSCWPSSVSRHRRH